MIIKKKIYFEHDQNLMKNEGDIHKAREYFYKKKNKNLYKLLENRYSWINKFLSEDDKILELGSGANLLKDFIDKKIYTSDFNNNEFLDYKNVDACNTGFSDNSFDKVISSNLIHHIAYPVKHFNEINRILKSGGLYVIQDINCSLVTQMIVMLMKHEGYDFTKDVCNSDVPVNNPADPWSANIAAPNLIFNNFDKFNEQINNKFEIKFKKYSEFILFLNSGGVIAKTFHIPLNNFLNNLVNQIDNLFVKFPKIFAMQMSIVLEKK
jgi:SAM-dependent methyltransferase